MRIRVVSFHRSAKAPFKPDSSSVQTLSKPDSVQQLLNVRLRRRPAVKPIADAALANLRPVEIAAAGHEHPLPLGQMQQERQAVVRRARVIYLDPPRVPARATRARAIRASFRPSSIPSDAPERRRRPHPQSAWPPPRPSPPPWARSRIFPATDTCQTRCSPSWRSPPPPARAPRAVSPPRRAPAPSRDPAKSPHRFSQS